MPFQKIIDQEIEFHVKQNKELFEQLYKIQEKYNEHTNITRISTKEDFYTKSIKDSLAINPFITKKNIKIIDIGSGAGYPGIPLAISCPDNQITMVDSVAKKTKYLESAKKQLSIKNTSIITDRGENLGHNIMHREKYDIATARAVADTSILLEICAPLIKTKGLAILMKGPDHNKETMPKKTALEKLGLIQSKTIKYTIENNQRTLLIFKKSAPTEPQYPRKTKKIKKTPLC